MNNRTVGLGLLNLSAALVIVGACYDLLVPSVPANHLTYLGTTAASLGPRFAELDLAMLRSIGGCLLAIGIVALVLVNGPVRRGDRFSGFLVALLIGIAEGNNAWRMYHFGSPWYGPLSFVVLAIAGALLVRLSARPSPMPLR